MTLNKLITLSVPQPPHWRISTDLEGHLLSTCCILSTMLGFESTMGEEPNVVPGQGQLEDRQVHLG